MFKERFGRDSGGLLKTYRCEDAAVRILAMGSSVGTIEDAVDELRAEGLKVGVVSLRCFRPFPMQAVREALQGARVAIVLDRAIGAGSGGVVLLDVVNAMRCSEVAIKSVIGGLGGRAITKKSIKDILRAANEGTLSDTTFMDLDEDLVEHDEVVEGYLARVMQHEFDHLDGKMFIDHLSALRKQMIKGKLNAMLKGKARCSYKVKTVK